MNYRIIGTTLPVLELQLNPGESVYAVSGELSWMNSAITMNTTTQFGGGGGFFGALKRMAGGGSLFMTDYRAEGGEGLLAFATRVPGSILFLEISPTETYLIHRHGFLCATHGVELNVGFQQTLGAGIFGGDGFLLQKVNGTGHAWIELDGEVVTYDLKPGETYASASGSCGDVPGIGELSNRPRSRYKKHAIRRRWNLSGRAHRTWPNLAAIPTLIESGTRSSALPAKSGRASRRRRRWRRNRLGDTRVDQGRLGRFANSHGRLRPSAPWRGAAL